MIKEGDSVICIKEFDIKGFIYLTLHKVYTVSKIKYWSIKHHFYPNYRIFIKDNVDAEWVFESDKLEMLLFFKDYFITLAEWREQQINSILED